MTADSTASANQRPVKPVRELVLDGLLPTSNGGTFELIGEITGWGATGEDGGNDVSPVDLVLPFAVDGVRTDVEFAVETNEETRVLTAAGVEVPRSRQDDFLESAPVPVFRAVVRPTESGKLRALELQELPDAGREPGTPTASASPSDGPQIRSLSGRGVLPVADDGTLEVVGKRIGSAGTDNELEVVDLEVPLVIDGVAASVQLALVVNDETTIVDQAGREVPRLDQERAVYKVARMWQATVRTSEQGRLVVLTMRPATGG